jgi:hypothetical protein
MHIRIFVRRIKEQKRRSLELGNPAIAVHEHDQRMVGPAGSSAHPSISDRSPDLLHKQDSISILSVSFYLSLTNLFLS